MFKSRVNSVTGKMEWVVTEKYFDSLETDFAEEFSRSQYGDMLHDTERNQKYEQGLRWAINHMLSKGVEPRVLDIGTGTGLLSMMAARCGAKNVTACEVLKPMVKISRTAIEENGYQDIINVIPKRSTEVIVGPDGDMSQRANILVTEVFDSELIGEGAIPTFRHAVKELLEYGCLIIPSDATVYAQLVESEFLWRSQSLDPHQLPRGISINIPKAWTMCKGPASLWDIHLEEVIRSHDMRSHDVIPLSEPHVVAKFSFSDPSLPIYKEYSPIPIPSIKTGSCHAIAIWWTITLAPGVELSMSPWQLNAQWRDHWLACVQVLPQPLPIEKDNTVELQAINDEYTMWTIIRTDSVVNSPVLKRPVCSCGIHLAWSRSRLRMMNDLSRNQQFMTALSKILPSKSSVLSVSDGSLLPVLCAHTHTSLKNIFAVEGNSYSASSLSELIEHSTLPIPVQILTKFPTELTSADVGNTPIDVLLSEPFFITSTLPWHNLYFWYIRSAVDELLSPNAVIMPCVAYLKAIAVKFQNLHLLKAPVCTVEGFDISAYDRAVAKCHKGLPQQALDPEDYSLWEYPCYPLSRVETLMKFDFTQPVPSQMILQNKGSWPLNDTTSPCHGVVLWIEYQLTKEVTDLVSEGLLRPPEDGYELVWSTAHNEAVCFFMDYKKSCIQYTVQFDTSNGEMEFVFL